MAIVASDTKLRLGLELTDCCIAPKEGEKKRKRERKQKGFSFLSPRILTRERERESVSECV